MQILDTGTAGLLLKYHRFIGSYSLVHMFLLVLSPCKWLSSNGTVLPDQKLEVEF